MLTLLAAVSGSGLISILIWVVVVAVIFWLLWWLVDYIKLPEPFNKVVKVILAVVAVIFLINALLTMAGHPIVTF